MLCNLEITRLLKSVLSKRVFDDKTHKKLVVSKLKFGIAKNYVPKIKLCWHRMCLRDALQLA